MAIEPDLAGKSLGKHPSTSTNPYDFITCSVMTAMTRVNLRVGSEIHHHPDNHCFKLYQQTVIAH